MPFPPPVTIAVRPASLAMVLALPANPAGERLEARELQLDQIDGGLILELERLVVEFLRGKGDDDLRAAEQDAVDRGERHSQVILHARAAENAAGRGLQRHRLVFERLILHARHPVDRILEAARDRPIVFRRYHDHRVGAADGVGPGIHLGGKAGRALDVEIVDRNFLERRRRAQLEAGGRERRQRARQRRVVGALAQGAADHQHVELISHDQLPSQLFGATRAMKVANAASCFLMKPRVASSLSSPVFSSNFEPQLPTKISGLLSTKASRNAIALRMSYCTRAPPTGPGEADCSATALPANGWFCRRDTQSMAFFRPPGMVKLYSGVQKITPSAARMASASAFTGAGKPVELWMSAL